MHSAQARSRVHLRHALFKTPPVTAVFTLTFLQMTRKDTEQTHGKAWKVWTVCQASHWKHCDLTTLTIALYRE